MQCKDCNSFGTITIDISSGCEVCECCGSVYEQSQLTDGTEYNAISNGTLVTGCAPRYRTTNGFIWYENSLKDEVKRQCEFLCGQFVKSENFFGTVWTFVSKYMENKWATGRKRDLIISSCIYIVARQQKRPLTLLDISKATKYSVFLIGGMYTKVQQKLKIDVEDMDHSIYIAKVLKQIKPDIDDGEVWNLGQLGSDIMSLVKESVAPGRKPTILMGAAVVLLCQMNRIKPDIKAIAEELSVAQSSIMARKTELRTYLIQLGTTILPFTQSITKSNFLNYIPDIIRHFQLIQQLEQKQSEEKTAQNSEEAECKYYPKKDTPMDKIRKNLSLAPPSLRAHQMKRENRRKRVEKAKQRLLVILSKGKKDDGEVSESQMDGEDLLIERMLLEGIEEDKIIDGEDLSFAEPICHPDLNDPTLGEYDIPDKQMSLYIRSPQEIELLQRVKSLTQ